jgi:GNAT superfamily N-acetyltransferase
MGLRFIRDTGYCRHIGGDPAVVAKFLDGLIDGGGPIFVSERAGIVVGMLGLLIFTHPFSGEKVASELFWWVEPDSRGDGLELMRRAENEARARGAQRMQMIAPNEAVARIYRRKGYEYVESTYQRKL